MKFKYILVSLGLGAALLSGCSSSDGDDIGDTIIGTWHKSCYLPDGHDQYMVRDSIVKSDNTIHIKKVYYDDEDCTLNPTTEEYDLTYKIGDKTVDSDGKTATKVDFIGTNSKYYAMFKFKANGNLLISGEKGTNDGSSDAKRANYFSINWTGYVKQ